MPEQTYDLAIVGGGAAGLTAGLYACRAGLKTVLFESLMTGGQVINAENIENFPGFPDGISGAEFGPLLQEQATRYGLEIRLGEVTALRPESQFWAIELYGGLERARAVIYAAGLHAAKARRAGRAGPGGRGGFLLRHLRRAVLPGRDRGRGRRRRLRAGRGARAD